MRVVISVRFLAFPPPSPALPVPCPEVATLSDSFDKRHRCGVSGLHTSHVSPGGAAITITGH